MTSIRLCSIPDCEGIPKCGGFCNKHYQRWLRYGDPVGGSTFNGEPAKFYARALAYEGDECLIWPFSKTGHGYGRIWVNNKTRDVHLVLCEEVNGPPPGIGFHAAHSCGKGHLGCVTKKHLSWKTPVENAADKILHGTAQRGEKAPSAKLSDAQVREIRALQGQLPRSEIAKRFGCTVRTLSRIYTGQGWRHLIEPTKIEDEVPTVARYFHSIAAE